MATVMAGMTVSLDGFEADPQGSASRLYSDLADLSGTDGNNHHIQRIQAEAAAREVQASVVLNFIHVIEYVWKAAWSVHNEGNPAAELWVRKARPADPRRPLHQGCRADPPPSDHHGPRRHPARRRRHRREVPDQQGAQYWHHHLTQEHQRIHASRYAANTIRTTSL